MDVFEHAVGAFLRGIDISRTRLQAARLAAVGRRSLRRRRIATAAATVLALAVPAAVVVRRETRPQPPAGSFATTTRVVHRSTPVTPARHCPATPFPAPAPGEWAAHVTDPTGAQVVGVRTGDPAVTLWTRGTPARFEWPGPQVTTTAVNPAGTVVGAGPAAGYVHRGGVSRVLAAPAGRPARAVAVNERGDVLGVLDDVALVVWPADSPDRPRVIDERGVRPVAIRDDGTVVAVRDGAVVVHGPDGGRRELPFGNDGLLARAVLRGDVLYTTYATGAPPATRNSPVRWNLRTGLVEIFDDLTLDDVRVTANAAGWFVAVWPGVSRVVVPPGGPAAQVPAGEDPLWISADGSARIGTRLVDGRLSVVRWTCQPGLR